MAFYSGAFDSGSFEEVAYDGNISFDGPTKTISVVKTPSSGRVDLSIQDIYSRWKDWVIQGTNAKYLPAFSVIGGEPTGPGTFAGTTYFVINGWKIKPYEDDHLLVISGNVVGENGSNFIIPTIGNYTTVVQFTFSSLAQGISTSGASYTVQDIVDGVWNEDKTAHTVVDSFGYVVQNISGGTGTGDWTTTEKNQIRHRLGLDGVTQAPSTSSSLASVTAEAVRTELNTELTHLLTLQNGQGLNSTQATMLLEIYRLYGLDPTKPLVVAQTSRTAGAEIQQSISELAGVVTVTRQ